MESHGSAGMSQKVGIVGSRKRTDQETVRAIVAGLPSDAVVVSGGACGVDAWAAAAARARGLQVVEHLPDMAGAVTRWERTERFYARNAQIAEGCDRLVALVADDRKGGTEDTIRRARRLGRPVEVVRCDGTREIL